MLLTIQMVVLMITATYAYIYYIIVLALGCLFDSKLVFSFVVTELIGAI